MNYHQHLFSDIPFILQLAKHLNVQESEAKWNPHTLSSKSVKWKQNNDGDSYNSRCKSN